MLLLSVLWPIVLGVLAFALSNVMTQRSERSQLQGMDNLVRYTVAASSFVHESQKERGRTGGYVGSDGSEFADELAEQRQATDAALIELQPSRRRLEPMAMGESFEEDLRAPEAFVDQLPAHRRLVDELSTTDGWHIDFYTAMHYEIVTTIAHLVRMSSDARVSRLASAYLNTIKGKEDARLERAGGAGTLKRTMQPSLFRSLRLRIHT